MNCWGEVGWTIIDYYLKRKPSFYYVKRSFAPRRLILRANGGTVCVMGVNDTAEAISVDAEYGYVAFDGSFKAAQKTVLLLEPRSRKPVLEFAAGDNDSAEGIVYIKPLTSDTDILPATLRACEFRRLRLPEPDVQISGIRFDGNDIHFLVSCGTYAHAVHFGLDDDIRLSDEYFDLLPGESREVTVFGAAGRLSMDDIRPIAVTGH